MFRNSSLQCSASLHRSSSPFVHASLQLMKIHLQHKSVLEEVKRAHSDGASSTKQKEARAIENMFRRELDQYRAVFTLSAQTEAAKMYASKIVAAMSHFGMRDDPLVRQIEHIMGRHALRNGSTSGSRNLLFKGVGSQPQHAPNALQATAESLLPSELPMMRPLNEDALPRDAVKVPANHRGHWVLRDPEIALTREGRKFDAW